MMAEETQVPTPETPTSSQPEATSGETPTVSVDSTVRIGDKDIPISDLVNGYQKLGNLEEYKKNASVLVRGTPMSQDDRNKAMRFILEQEGYAPSQIDEQLRTTDALYESDEEGYDYGEEEDNEQMTNENQQPEASPNVDPAAREEIERVRDQSNKMMVDMLKRDLTDSMNYTMTTNQSVKTLLDKSKQLAGEDGYVERESNIRSEIQRIAMENMRSRRNRGEKFDKSWFNQETDKAADSVYQRIRSVIGDPDKIQRAPETASETEQFFSKPPVPAPKFEAGDNMGTATDKAHDFTVDTLSRLANDLSAGGDSRI
jgi:hypothetical protein